MASPKRPVRRATLVMLGVLALAVSACTGGPAATTSSTSVADVPVRAGGSLIIGSEQEPGCADWISSCAGSVYGTYIMMVQTLPEVFQYRQVDGTWQPKASALMASEPTTKVVDGKQQITYRLNPKAVWSDGRQITSADLKYTALQIRDGKDVYDKTGYSRITSIATPDAQTAIVTLGSPYVNWKDLFSGFLCVLPSHLLQGKNRNAIMKNGYSFSGGPWKIQSWQRGASVTLVPNKNYWGAQPKLDKVTFQFTANTSSEFLAFKSGQLDSIYPTPQLDALNEIKAGLSNVRTTIATKTPNVEALWLNNAQPPFNDLAVRKAFAYAIDRKALVNRLYGALGVTTPAQSFWPGPKAEFGGKSFAAYGLDLAKVDSTMKAAGWSKGSDGIWQHAGTRAAFTLASQSGDTRRLLAEQIIQAQLKTAGFAMSINNTTSSQLFGTLLPHGDFQATLFTLIATDPTDSFTSSAIPTKANDYAGLNFQRVHIPQLDTLLNMVATTVDTTQRAALGKQADQVMADNAVSLPLDDVPTVLLTNRRVGGPISVNPIEGPFWNLNEWGLAR